jgi:hypothetical protein
MVNKPIMNEYHDKPPGYEEIPFKRDSSTALMINNHSEENAIRID